MRLLRDPTDMRPDDRGAVAAIGNFDGVHLGHRSVIDIAGSIAARRGASLGVVTFEPHPREFFVPDAPPFRLMSPQARAHRLAKLGVGLLVELPFDAWMASLPPEAFVEAVLRDGFHLTHVVVGDGFRFGHGRKGTAADLERLGRAAGLGVTVAPLLGLGEGGVSSTAIRAALSEGRPREAARMLGHLHRIEGEVLHGDRRGRELGYPTANLSMAGLHPPRFGVYAVSVDVLDGRFAGRRLCGAASIGVRPTFGGGDPNCEAFLLDFAGDLYGATLSVGLVDFLRPELRFDGAEALVLQMGRDVEEARRALTDA